ncbi:UbiD family decarboxylase [Candidatus Laterigemmans baculatus]|uniref:UbiD family decarboxylase n=1 Tax=Candidatus Laterigemmans baculatus TaxID=2770505 RepID=UPI0013DA13E7|nr:UbiD family decarboxylase [Candidatus Laterigemmans baculatus]
MKHRSTREVVEDLRRGGRLVECEDEVDSFLEMAEIQRRVYARGGPAVYFPRVRGCGFPCVSNLFGSLDQARYLFRDTLESVRRLVELKIDPQALPRHPWRYASVPLAALRMLPQRVSRGPVQAHRCRIDELPQIQSWPDDGGAFVTLPQVLSEDPEAAGNLMRINLGMYRVQLAGNQYAADEVGLHYQIHRGIGVHHRAALARGEALRVAVTVGGSPAMTLAAVMPLPEGLTELTFAGALAGRRIRMIVEPGKAPVYADADFAIRGHIVPGESKPEGPFGDHLGYYSLQHDFPVLHVERVWHREGAVWPFTVVGRPPQEDTTFGELIHELTGPIIPTVIPGVQAVHAVDAAGVHPLLLAIGSERYMPFLETTEPAELLTQAHAILGNGQLSLAKYLMIVNGADDPALRVDCVPRFLEHLLRRVDWRRDLHFQTRTTIDTLDYSGEGLNRGSKVVIAATGAPLRELPTELPGELRLPPGYHDPRVVAPGILAITAPSATGSATTGGSERATAAREFCDAFSATDPINRFPLVTLVDDARFAAERLENWLWVTFTRSNPASDIDGIAAETVHRHWGCRGSMVIDARRKPHHAPPLVEDPKIQKRVDARATRGGELAQYL